MQSIYRFRDAEVGLFLRARDEGLGQICLESLALVSNFRSQADLVEWFNSSFQNVFPPQEDRNTGAIRYSPAVASRPALPGPGLRVHPLFQEDPVAEAAQVVEAIRAEREGDPLARIVILVRSREHLREILPALRREGLPFQAVELEKLDTRPVVQDLVALTRALLHPGDRIAWLALLRSPWCGLTMRDLALLTEGWEGSILDLLADEASLQRLDPDSRRRCQDLARNLREALAVRRRQSLRRWVEGTWMALGGPACLSEPGALEDALAWLALLEAFDERSEWPDGEALEARLSRLYARPDPTAGPELQVMTIHRAKGLEFDVVLLPGLGRRTRPPGQPLMLWAERLNQVGSSDLLLGPIAETGRDRDPIYAYLSGVESSREANETARLLYVAATRAIRRLHIFGHTACLEQDGQMQMQEPAQGTVLSLLWPVVAADFQSAWSQQPLDRTAPERPESAAIPEPEPGVTVLGGMEGPGLMDEDAFAEPLPPLLRIPSGLELPDPPPSLPVPAAREETRDDDPDFRWAGETVRQVGTLVHRVLNRWGHRGLAGWNRSRLEAMRPSFVAALARLGVPQHERASGAEATVQALVRLLECPRGRWILDDSHREARSEYSLAGLLGGRVVRVQMDRTFVDDRGLRWIVDYKTGTHEGSDLEAFLDAEQERYRPQLERYALLLRRLDRRPMRLGIYFPMLGGWREWEAPR